MCVIIHKPKNVAISESILEDCYYANPDGFGMTLRSGGKLRVSRGMFGLKKIKELVRKCHEHELLIHYRWATHGTKDKTNCHPFPVFWDDGRGFVFCHNGILPLDPRDDRISDTHEMALQMRESMHPDLVRERLDDFSAWHGYGNRLAFLWDDGAVSKTGTWQEHQGCWFSNLNWRGRSTAKSSTVYSRPYSRYDDYYSGDYCGGGWREAHDSGKWKGRYTRAAEKSGESEEKSPASKPDMEGVPAFSEAADSDPFAVKDVDAIASLEALDKSEGAAMCDEHSGRFDQYCQDCNIFCEGRSCDECGRRLVTWIP